MSKVNALYHIVFCTKHRMPTIENEYRDDLYRYILTCVINKKSKLVRISGIPNHLHMLVDLHPSVSLSDFMRDIKSYSSTFLKSDGRFPYFEGWAREYYAATIGFNQKPAVIEYIKSQQDHHRTVGFDEELADMIEGVGLTLYEDDFLR